MIRKIIYVSTMLAHAAGKYVYKVLAFVGTCAYKLTKWWLIPNEVETGTTYHQREEYRNRHNNHDPQEVKARTQYHQREEYHFRHNNHDDQKRSYYSREDAEVVRRRMQDQECDSWERLNVYYNDERDAWFIGNCSRY